MSSDNMNNYWVFILSCIFVFIWLYSVGLLSNFLQIATDLLLLKFYFPATMHCLSVWSNMWKELFRFWRIVSHHLYLIILCSYFDLTYFTGVTGLLHFNFFLWLWEHIASLLTYILTVFIAVIRWNLSKPNPLCTVERCQFTKVQI